MPEANQDPAQIDNSSHHIVAMPNGDTIALPKSMDDSQLSSIAHHVYQIGHDATTSAWDEIKEQGKGLKQMFSAPKDTDPADERHVAVLGPLSLQAYRMGKQALSAVSANHLAAKSGEGVIGSNLAMWEQMPMVGDVVRLMEQGKITPAIAKGLTRAALLKGTADLSSTAVERLSPEAASAAEVHPSAKTPTATTTAPPAAEVPAVEPMTPEQRLASAFMRKQRAILPEKSGVIESAGRAEGKLKTDIDTKTGVAKTREFSAEESQAASDADVKSFIEQHFGKDVSDRVRLAGDEPAVRGTAADESALASQHFDALTRLASDAGDADAVTQFSRIKQRLFKKTETTEPKYRVEKDGTTDVHKVEMRDAEGDVKGHLEAHEYADQPAVLNIVDSSTGSNAGRGLGTKMYAKLFEQAKKVGSEVRSGGVPSDSAAATWKALKRAGWNVTETETPKGSTFKFTPETEFKLPKTKPFIPRTFDNVDKAMYDWTKDLASESQ